MKALLHMRIVVPSFWRFSMLAAATEPLNRTGSPAFGRLKTLLAMNFPAESLSPICSPTLYLAHIASFQARPIEEGAPGGPYAVKIVFTEVAGTLYAFWYVVM